MHGRILQITADYRDGLVYVSGKKYPAGYFAVRLLNQYYENDTAARVSVYKQYIWHVQNCLTIGYLDYEDFEKVGRDILEILKTVPKLKPFDSLDVEAECERIQTLFTAENARQIIDYWRRKAVICQIDENEAALDLYPKRMYDEEVFKRTSDMLDDVYATLNYYDQFGRNMEKAFSRLRKFVYRQDEAERLDEGYLLPLALDVFGTVPFPLTTEYVRLKKNARSSTATLARRMYFDNYYSFVVTDFFEGLHYGHYPRQCEICKNYFLMTSARRQKYCLGKAPEKLNGKTVSCGKYAAAINRKEHAQNDPIASLYTNRCTAIRTEKGRGTITAEFAECAKKLAKEHKYRAYEDDEYARVQYAADMERVKLYADTDRQLRS